MDVGVGAHAVDLCQAVHHLVGVGAHAVDSCQAVHCHMSVHKSGENIHTLDTEAWHAGLCIPIAWCLCFQQFCAPPSYFVHIKNDNEDEAVFEL